MKRLIGKMIVTSGIVVALAGCGSSASSGPTQSNSAPAAAAATTTWTTAPDSAGQGAPADASGQPAPADSQQASGGGGQGGPGVMGQVVSIDGTTMVVKGQGDQGADITVTLNDSTKISKQTTVDIASVPVGESVTAMGVQEGNVFTATQIRIGATTDAGGPGGRGAGGTPQAGGPGADQQGGTPPAGGADQQGQAGGNRGQRLSGTVEALADGTLTVKTTDGTSILVRLAENGQVTQQVDGTQADITVGAQVMVVGAQTDSAVTATQISVMPATTKQQ